MNAVRNGLWFVCSQCCRLAAPRLKQRAGVVGVMAVILAVHRAGAATVAHDDASDPAYNSGWTNGSNGGSGWGEPWRIGNNNSTGFAFIGSSARNGASVDTNGKAFGMGLGGTSGSPSQISAMRLFGANPNPNSLPLGFDHSLLPGQTLRIDTENGAIGSGVSEAWGLQGRLGMGTELGFVFLASTITDFTHGKPDYVVFDNAGYRDTGVPITDQGVHCEFTVLDIQSNNSEEDYALAITPLTKGAATTTVYGSTVFGSVNNELQLSDGNGSASSPPDISAQYLYFNNIAIVPAVPEPMSVGSLSLVGLGLLMRRRR